MSAAFSCGSPVFPTELTKKVAEPEGVTTVRRGNVRESLGEDTPRTARLIAIKLADVQMQDDLSGLHRQILDRAGVSAMDTVSRRSTDGTYSSLRDAFTREDQVLVLLLR
jgi:hypothetical protein